MLRFLVLCGAVLAAAACGRDAGKARAADAKGREATIAAALDPCSASNAAARTVCGNQKLSALDGQIRQALVAEAAEVSSAGAQTLVQGQQRWLQVQRLACGIVDPDARPDAKQTQCLEARLRERAAEAAQSVEQIGGYTFQRMEIVSAQAVTAQAADASRLEENAPAAIVRDIRFPRIDNASTPQAARFNQLVAQQPQFRLEEMTEEQVDYSIAYAGPELISVRFDTYDNTMGAAHPNSGMKAVTVVMTTGQPLTAADVFRRGSGWEAFLTGRATDALTRQFREYDFAPPQADVRDAVTKPHLWLVKEEGLVLLFPPYSFGGPYALGGAEVTIPWRDLARYLNPNAPSPIRAA
jgi:uncharacterized protein